MFSAFYRQPSLRARIREFGMHELLDRWELHHQSSQRLPTIEALDLEHAVGMPWLFRYELVDLDPPTLLLRHLGSALAVFGQLVNDIPDKIDLGRDSDLLRGHVASYRQCLRLRTPVHEHLRMTVGASRTLVMERLLLPCQSSTTPEHQLVGMNVYSEREHAPLKVPSLDSFSDAQLDALPFGVIKLDRHGVVQKYSKVEHQNSGYAKPPPLGLDFFTRVAPCMNTPRIKGRITACAQAGTFDAEFTHIGDACEPDRELLVRAFSSADGGIWLALAR